jgi:hypothetical protein
MQEELNNFKRNEVWNLVPCPSQKVIETKWVFHTSNMDMVWSQEQGVTCGQRLFIGSRFRFR